MLIRLFLVFTLTLSVCTSLLAQPYNSALGARLGMPAGLSYKVFLNDVSALEGVAAVRIRHGFVASLWYERHSEVFTEQMLFVYGFGGHAGTYDEHFEFGADGILGLEYVFEQAPVSFMFDVNPTLSIRTNVGFLINGAFTLRYIF